MGYTWGTFMKSNGQIIRIKHYSTRGHCIKSHINSKWHFGHQFDHPVTYNTAQTRTISVNQCSFALKWSILHTKRLSNVWNESSHPLVKSEIWWCWIYCCVFITRCYKSISSQWFCSQKNYISNIGTVCKNRLFLFYFMLPSWNVSVAITFVWII